MKKKIQYALGWTVILSPLWIMSAAISISVGNPVVFFGFLFVALAIFGGVKLLEMSFSD